MPGISCHIVVTFLRGCLPEGDWRTVSNDVAPTGVQDERRNSQDPSGQTGPLHSEVRLSSWLTSVFSQNVSTTRVRAALFLVRCSWLVDWHGMGRERRNGSSYLWRRICLKDPCAILRLVDRRQEPGG